MTTAAQPLATDLAGFRTAQNDLVALASDELTAFLGTLDLGNVRAVMRALEGFLTELVQGYGEIAAMLAADVYAELRDMSPEVRGSFTPILSAVADRAEVGPAIGWATKPLLGANPDAATTTARLTGVTDRLVKAGARATIEDNVAADPARPRYARVPTGSETCAFCLMLASRGAVYSDERAAGRGRDYHGDCDCQPRPVWGELDLARLRRDEGYDLDAFRRAYAQGVADADSSATSDVLAGIRRATGAR